MSWSNIILTFEFYENSNICYVLLQVQYDKLYMVQFEMNHQNLGIDLQSKVY